MGASEGRHNMAARFLNLDTTEDVWLPSHPCSFIPEERTPVKVKWSRYTPWRRLGVEEVQLLLILNLGTRWGWVVSITPRPRFTPGEKTSRCHCTGGWVGPRASLDAEARGKSSAPVEDRTPIFQSIVRHCTDWATAAPKKPGTYANLGASESKSSSP
jgi:hypothetical protein